MPIITVRNYPKAIDPPRAPRYKNRHTPAAAADELNIPQGWIWFWIWSKKLKVSPWLGKAWVNLDEVRELARTVENADLAFEATSQPLLSKKGLGFASANWPEPSRELGEAV